MTSKRARPSKQAPSQTGKRSSQQALAALPGNYQPRAPTVDELREYDTRAQAILDAIDDESWGDFIELCTDIQAPVIAALVDLLRAATRRRLERVRKQRSETAASNAAVRWKDLKPLRKFACEKHDAQKWPSAKRAANRILPDVIEKRNQLGLAIPIDSNAASWLLDVLSKHRRKLRDAKH